MVISAGAGQKFGHFPDTFVTQPQIVLGQLGHYQRIAQQCGYRAGKPDYTAKQEMADLVLGLESAIHNDVS